MKRKSAAEQERAVTILGRLDAAMPEAKIELDYTTDLELLVAVILSAQCTDKRVNMVTPALFRDFRTPADYAKATPEQIGTYIQSLGLYRNKAKALVALGQALSSAGGAVPREREKLAELPGVGQKTAGVVALHLGGTPSFPVDTHVGRLARRMGFTREQDPDKVEADLQALIPQAWWSKGHQLLVWHGRRTCYARAPECGRCVVGDLCPRRGVTKPGKTTAGAGKPGPAA